jgi:hypothetical protein
MDTTTFTEEYAESYVVLVRMAVVLLVVPVISLGADWVVSGT